MTNEVVTPSVTRMKQERTQGCRMITGLWNKIDELLKAPDSRRRSIIHILQDVNKILQNVKKRMTSTRRWSATKRPLVSFQLRLTTLIQSSLWKNGLRTTWSYGEVSHRQSARFINSVEECETLRYPELSAKSPSAAPWSTSSWRPARSTASQRSHWTSCANQSPRVTGRWCNTDWPTCATFPSRNRAEESTYSSG